MGNSEYDDTNGQSGLNGRSEAVNKIRTSASVSMDAELFEKLYLSPPNKAGRKFGDPIPLALAGYLAAMLPLCSALMGWRGSSTFSAASIPVYFFMGGLMMFFGGVLQWFLGNSFLSTAFISYGSFFLALGGTLTPSFGAYATYAPADATSSAEGLTTTGFNAGMGFWIIAMAVLSLIYFICSLRTNAIFAVFFLLLVPAFSLLAGGFWLQAENYTGNASDAADVFEGSGAIFFVSCLGVIYLLLAVLLEAVDFPFRLPVFPLSKGIKGKSTAQESV